MLSCIRVGHIIVLCGLLVACGGGGGTGTGTGIGTGTGTETLSDPEVDQNAGVDVDVKSALIDDSNGATLARLSARIVDVLFITVNESHNAKSLACSKGGTLGIVHNDSNSNGLIDAGDTLDGSYLGCKISRLGETLERVGVVTMSLSSGEVSTSNTSYQGELLINNMSLTWSGEEISMNANMKVVAETTESQIKLDVKGSDFNISTGEGTVTVANLQIQLVLPVDGSNGQFTAAFTLDSSAQNGVVSAVVDPPMLYVPPSNQYPSVGKLMLTGDLDTYASLEADDANTLSVLLDINGSVQKMPWQWMMNPGEGPVVPGDDIGPPPGGSGPPPQ